MKTLKKFSLILVVIAMLFTVGGCSQEKETKTDNQTATTQNNKGSEKGNEKNKDEGSDYERADFLTKTYKIQIQVSILIHLHIIRCLKVHLKCGMLTVNTLLSLLVLMRTRLQLKILNWKM